MTIKEFEIQYALGTLSDIQLYDIAMDSDTPTNMIIKLSTDKDYYVRCRVADNSNAPVDILTKLSTDEDRYVRCRVAENPNTPIDTLNKLSKDEDWITAHSARETLSGRLK